jgi:hypothetical protein
MQNGSVATLTKIFRRSVATLMVAVPLLSMAQELPTSKHWLISVSPGISKSRLPHGVVVTYDDQFWVNLKIREPYQFAFSTDVGREGGFRNWRGWGYRTSLRFSTYSYKLYYDYDRELSEANNVSDEYDFNFIDLTFSLWKSFKVGKNSLLAHAGLSANAILTAKWTYTSEMQTLKFNLLGLSSKYNLGADYHRFNYGLDAGLTYRIGLNDRLSLDIRPTYTWLLRGYKNERQLYSYALALGIVF